MGREIRRVPERWEHPVKQYPDGIGYRRLVQAEYDDYRTEFEQDDPGYPFPYTPEDFMPTGDWYQLFETVSEGTPLSPPFATADELVAWLSTHRDYSGRQWTTEQAHAIVEIGWAPSGIMIDNRFYGAEEAVEVVRDWRR